MEIAPVQPPDAENAFIGGDRAVSGRGYRNLRESQCSPAYFVDGAPVEVKLDQVPFPVPVSDIRAIEIYTAATVPFEFQRTTSLCGAIVVWTKEGRDTGGAP